MRVRSRAGHGATGSCVARRERANEHEVECMKLAGQVALVTGSGQRMGRAILLALAEAGANVVVNSVTNREAMEQTAEEARTHGVKAIACLADVRDRAAVDKM